jgi:type IV secretion system protein VirB9
VKRPYRQSIVHRLAAAATGLCMIPLTIAETLPNPGVADARIRTAAYRQDEVYRLTGYVGYQTDLEFQQGETFVGLAAGDIEGISFVAQDNHLFLKPKVARVGTNLTIVTSRHTYQVDYSASAQRPDATQEVIYALRFTYPPDPQKESESATDKELETHRPRNFDYWYCGNPAIQPVAASDDGVHTRIRFAAHAEEPAIFVRNEDGSESLLNFSMDDGDVILHRVAHRLILRRGKLAGCIVNKGFVGSGERMKSNTTSENVERATKGPRS